MMSVYTPIQQHELEELLSPFSLSDVESFRGIEAGVQNSNFFVTTKDGEYILTIFETLASEELPFFIALTNHISKHGVVCPAPIKDSRGVALHTFEGKPVLLLPKFPGHIIERPKPKHIVAIATALAKMHVASAQFNEHRINPHGPDSWAGKADELKPHLKRDESIILQEELNHCQQLDWESYPKGIIHADLFRDNALFEHDELAGIIDFYDACDGALAFDLAICINAWCFDEQTIQNHQLTELFINTYQQFRPLTEHEKQDWASISRAAALRWWLSRLKNTYSQRHSELANFQDPDEMKHIILQHRARPYKL